MVITRDMKFMINEMYDLRKKWHSIKRRCYNKNSDGYKNYGAKGIKVCDEWITNFISFYEWSILNGYKKGLTIDRIDNKKGYSPTNCRYVNRKIQNNNTTRNKRVIFNGIEKTLGELSEEYNIDYQLLYSRFHYRNMSLEKALSMPPRRIYDGKSQRRGPEKKIVSIKDNRTILYNSLIEAEYITGVRRKNISKVLRGTNKTAGGYIWKYEVEA
jgi:hypothetical protein